jgi:16S rRNA (cytosine1402-N4)-methyltransferase
MDNQLPHQPVLYQETLNIFQPKSTGIYVDGTLGAGGHAFGILETSSPTGRLIGLDLDGQAISIARKRLAVFGKRVTILNESYANIRHNLQNLGITCVTGILLDLGLSSMQLDTAQRGFSFIKEAPLDMRFDRSAGKTAAELVNNLKVGEIAEILFEYGEEPRAREIAKAIIQNRPIHTTTQLADLISGVYRGYRSRIHPGTRSFQALRIAVNNELETLKKGLAEGINSLCKGGRIAVISFHSLEDRIVKQYFRRESKDCICPPEQPVCTCAHKAAVRLVTKKPIVPKNEEIEGNPRARSAKLRAVEKI